ncbi:hypothetical protein E2562_019590 [Oryza meyeriana var. granulata]|uniref:Uncharacterized protein n=1 Tax=Oryza meyeriana var. granulata TaxID=110450 RepID=A0A6G1EX70_9ORYZ|nr:hypothetical protein E2562_019590 [Oryza meyeriana var. granulata]
MAGGGAGDSAEGSELEGVVSSGRRGKRERGARGAIYELVEVETWPNEVDLEGERMPVFMGVVEA